MNNSMCKGNAFMLMTKKCFFYADYIRSEYGAPSVRIALSYGYPSEFIAVRLLRTSVYSVVFSGAFQMFFKSVLYFSYPSGLLATDGPDLFGENEY